MEVLAQFDETDRRISSVVEGINYKDNAKRQIFIDKGYIPISEDDWRLYCMPDGGDNGTGYVRDPETGNPVSAPAYAPTREERATILFNECQADLKQIDAQIMNAIVLKDTELIEELRFERDKRIAEYEAALDELEKEGE